MTSHIVRPIASLVMASACAAAAQAQGGAGTQSPQSHSQGVPGAQQPAMTPSPVARDERSGSLAQADREFVRDAAQASQAEVEAARLALDKTANPAVKRFAQRMIDEHTQANAELTRIAARKNIQVPQGPGLRHQAWLTLLRTSEGNDFDRRYGENFGINAHQDTIALFQKQAQQGRDPDLQSFAQKTLPNLQQHLEMARTLPGAEEASAAANRSGQAGATTAQPVSTPDPQAVEEARREVTEAVQVVQKMKAEPQLTSMLQQAKGIFIVPDYGRGAAIVGGQAGSGVLVTRQGDGWSDPAFYNLGGVSIGAQAGGAGGPIAMLLMSDRAVEQFKSPDAFSLSADAGLTVADYSRRAQASTGQMRDVVVWSGTKGAYAGASVGATKVEPDEDANRAYYGREDVNTEQILEGEVTNPQNNVLEMVLGV